MLDAEEILKRYEIKFGKRINLIFDSLSCTYDGIKIVQEFHHISIYAFKDNIAAKVTVTYEALLDTNYVILIRQIKEAINTSMITACTIPPEYENPNV